MNLDDYRGRLLARAFHDELEKLSAMNLPTSQESPLASSKGLSGGGGMMGTRGRVKNPKPGGIGGPPPIPSPAPKMTV